MDWNVFFKDLFGAAQGIISATGKGSQPGPVYGMPQPPVQSSIPPQYLMIGAGLLLLLILKK